MAVEKKNMIPWAGVLENLAFRHVVDLVALALVSRNLKRFDDIWVTARTLQGVSAIVFWIKRLHFRLISFHYLEHGFARYYIGIVEGLNFLPQGADGDWSQEWWPEFKGRHHDTMKAKVSSYKLVHYKKNGSNHFK
jgi:hypothetical protein